MSNLHVYTTDIQPLTNYVDTNFDPAMRFTQNPRKLYHCHECGRRRWAKNLSIQVYYDSLRVFCADPVRRRSSEFPFEYGRFCPLPRKGKK